MKICLDARYLAHAPSGIGRYSANLIAELAKIDSRNEYVVLTHETYDPPALPANFRYLPCPGQPVSLWTLLNAGKLIYRLGCDLVHYHSPVLPFLAPGPYVVTFHDWLPLTQKGYNGGRALALKLAYDGFYRWQYPKVARGAGAVLTVSQTLRDETIHILPDIAAKTHAVPSGLDESLRAAPSDAAMVEVAAEHKLPARYILYVGSSRPNKQVPTLIEAFERLGADANPRAGGAELVLAMTRDRFTFDLLARIDRSPRREKIHIHWNVGDAALRVFYRGAAVVSMATTLEGFGFPVLEALAQGTPVVVSESGSPPELGGEAALRVRPADSAALAEALGRVLSDDALRGRLSGLGLERVRAYDWKSTAARTLEIYESALRA